MCKCPCFKALQDHADTASSYFCISLKISLALLPLKPTFKTQNMDGHIRMRGWSFCCPCTALHTVLHEALAAVQVFAFEGLPGSL